MRLEDRYRDALRKLRDASEARTLPTCMAYLRLTSLIRSMQQTLYLVALEVASQLVDPEPFEGAVGSWLDYNRKDSRSHLIFYGDSEPAQRMPKLLSLIRETSLVRRSDSGWASTLEDLLRGDLRCWRDRRNDLAHGAPAEAHLADWFEQDRRVAESLLSFSSQARLMPVWGDEGCPVVHLAGPAHEGLRELRVFCLPANVEFYPFVVRHAAVGGRRCRLALWPVDPTVGEKFIVHDVDPRSAWAQLQDPGKYVIETGYVRDQHLVARLPFPLPISPRSTAASDGPKIFGREAELQHIAQWWAEGGGGSKSLLVYGDGGIGKTAVIEEYLSRLVRGGYEDRPPSHICFATAKQTWFGDEPERGPKRETVEDMYAVLRACIDPRWNRQRGGATDRAAIERALDAQLVDPARFLVVIDNAETLGREAKQRMFADVAALGLRLIVTSREREDLGQGTSLLVPPLDQEPAEEMVEALLRARGETVARRESLEHAVEELRGLPLLLRLLGMDWDGRGDVEPYVDKLARGSRRESRQALTKFLYHDLWAKMPDDWQQMLVAIAHHDGTLGFLEQLYDVFHVPVLKIQETLEREYERFGDIREYGGDWEFVMHELAIEFLKSKIHLTREVLPRLEAAEENPGAEARREALRRLRFRDREGCWASLTAAWKADSEGQVIARSVLEVIVAQRTWTTEESKLAKKAAAALKANKDDAESLLLLARWSALHGSEPEARAARDRAAQAGAWADGLKLVTADAMLSELRTLHENWDRRAAEASSADDAAEARGEKADAQDELDADLKRLKQAIRGALDAAQKALRSRSPTRREQRRAQRAGDWARVIESELKRIERAS